jgi:hypothetical protein
MIWVKAKNEMSKDVLKFLESTFEKDMSQWKYDPGYAS